MKTQKNTNDTKQLILEMIKQHGAISASVLANKLALTREAVRQQLQQLHQQGLVETHLKAQKTAGRPTLLFQLTVQGEHLFPKNYDRLSVLLIDTISEKLGPEQVVNVLSAITDKQVAQWQDKLAGLDIRQKLQALKSFYLDDDPYIDIVEDSKGLWLVEHNCPFLNLAIERPALCSVTVSTLTRLLGVVVKREKRFQNGDGQCAFHIFIDQPIADNFSFALEV